MEAKFIGLLCSCMAAGLGVFIIQQMGSNLLAQSRLRETCGSLIELHASIAIFSYGIFALLSIVSAMYLIQRKFYLQEKWILRLFSSTDTRFRAGSTRASTNKHSFDLVIIVGGMHWSRNPEFVTTSKLFITLLVWLGYGVLLILRNKIFFLVQNLQKSP